MTHDKKGPVTLLKEQLEESAKSCKTFQEEYLRALADFENYRKRVERDSEQSRRFALEQLILDLLPVLDNFDRAVQVARNRDKDVPPTSIKGDVAGNRDKDVRPTGTEDDAVRKGMELIHRQLREALCKHGLEAYSCVGTEFDPRRAEAISFVHTDKHQPGTVVTETCKGYSCGERVLRPAKVIVAKELSRSQKPALSERSEPNGSDARSQNAEVADEEPGEIAEANSGSNGSAH
jgi:molecular chaperone GrpE